MSRFCVDDGNNDKYNILYVISYYDVRDGASRALYSQIICDQQVTSQYLVVCKSYKQVESDLAIASIDELQRIASFMKNPHLIIHYFKAQNSNILKKVCSLAPRCTRLITTVCQSPVYGRYLLSPYEMRKTWHFIFIDKTAYGESLIQFIPRTKCSQIYVVSDSMAKRTQNVPQKRPTDEIIYGRATTLAKCPADMFEVFDKIDIPNKRFDIVGIPNTDNWVRREAALRKNVKVYEVMPFEQWMMMCNNFDVFLYQLPNTCYASIDANLGLAMLLRKPVVYMGCAAPKERFIHEKNGFVAESIEEMALYATRLGKDADLRAKIGHAARESTLQQFSFERRRNQIYEVYRNTLSQEKHRIPIFYLCLYLKRCYKDIIKDIFDIT